MIFFRLADQRNGKGRVSWNVRESKCPYRLRSALFWFLTKIKAKMDPGSVGGGIPCAEFYKS